MNGVVRAKILILDQRKENESALAQTLARQKEFDVSCANVWREALSVSRDINVDAILCDGSVPWADVMEFCRAVRADSALSSVIFIVVGPPHGMDEKERGLEAGIDDWIEKSVAASFIIAKIKAWLRTRGLYTACMSECEALRMQNKNLLSNFKELTDILVKVLDSQLTGISERAHTARSMAEYIIEKLKIGEEEKRQILFAALLHEIGKVGLPKPVAEKNYGSLQFAEREVFVHHPAIGSMIISAVSGFRDSADAVYHQLENYDGSGIPDGLMGDEASPGARIIRAIVFQEELFKAGLPSETVIGHVKSSVNKVLDPVIADHLIVYLEEHDKSTCTSKARLGLDDLKTGMTLAEDVYSSNGIKLLPSGVVLQEKMISVLRERNHVDPIIGGIYVYAK